MQQPDEPGRVYLLPGSGVRIRFNQARRRKLERALKVADRELAAEGLGTEGIVRILPMEAITIFVAHGVIAAETPIPFADADDLIDQAELAGKPILELLRELTVELFGISATATAAAKAEAPASGPPEAPGPPEAAPDPQAPAPDRPVLAAVGAGAGRSTR